MKNFLTLLKVDILGMFGINKLLNKKSNTKSVVLAVLGLLFALSITIGIILMSSLYSYIFSTLAYDMLQSAENIAQIKTLPLSLGYSICLIVCIFSIIKQTQSHLFCTRDFDLLSSLPIKTSTFITEKLFFMYISTLYFFVTIFLPCGIVSGLFFGQTISYYAFLLFFIPFSPLLVITLGVLIGSILTYLTSFLKNKNLIYSSFSIILIGLYLFIMNSNDFSSTLADNILKIMPTLYITILPLVNGNLQMFAIGIALSVVLFVALVAIISKFYFSINMRMSNKRTNQNFKLSSKTSSKSASKDSLNIKQIKAILFIEFKKLLSVQGYLVNMLGGMILCLFASISISFQQLNNPGDDWLIKVMQFLLPVLLFALTSLTQTTSVSISLDHKQLDLYKSMPIKNFNNFTARVLLDMLIKVPIGAILTIVLSIIFKASIISVFCNFALLVLASLFFALFGLILNLHFPNLNQPSDIKIVKQSMSVLISTLGSMFVLLPIFAVCSFIIFTFMPMGEILLPIIQCSTLLALNVGAYFYLKAKSAKLYNKMS